MRHASPDAAAAPNADSVKVVYVSGGRLFTSVLGDGPTGAWGPVVGTEVLVEWRGSRAGRERRAVDAEDYVDGWSIHPEGLTMLANVRGRNVLHGSVGRTRAGVRAGDRARPERS